MSVLDHVVVVIEPVADQNEVAELARQAVVDGGRATVLLRLSAAFRADVARFADSEDLDFGLAQEIALEQLVARYREMIDPTANVIPVSADGRLPLEHPSLSSATAIVIDAGAVTDPALQPHLATSPLPVLLAPASRPARDLVGSR